MSNFIHLCKVNHVLLKKLLETKVKEYNHFGFIEKDPIQIPHRFKRKEDIEISALFASLFAWGKRELILQKLHELMKRMNDSPYEFVMSNPKKWQSLSGFKHRTIKDVDCLALIQFLNSHYKTNTSLESAFCDGRYVSNNIESALIHFQERIYSHPQFIPRARKHISSPKQKSSCKRLCMFLRWMVRDDRSGVDFGLWKNIQPSQLVMPMDIHVSRVAYRLGLIETSVSNWDQAIRLTQRLKELDEEDPVKYDYALFSLGIEEGMN